MKAKALLNERHQLGPEAFVELQVRRVPKRVPRSAHYLKYALAYIVGGVCVLRYDNEAGQGVHRHIDATETAYAFTTPDAPLADFWKDVGNWRSK